MTTSTRELLLDALENKPASNCKECNKLRRSYTERVRSTHTAEEVYRQTEEDSDNEIWARRAVAMRVRLEATCARRFLLHLMQYPHTPVGN